MRSFTDCCAPCPSATMAITADTPITMPSMVRNERSLLARSASKATRMVSANGMLAPSAAGACAPTATTRHAGHASAHALANALHVLRALGLDLGHAHQCHFLPFLDAVEHLRVVEVADAETHQARLESAGGLDEHHLAGSAPTAREGT